MDRPKPPRIGCILFACGAGLGLGTIAVWVAIFISRGDLSHATQLALWTALLLLWVGAVISLERDSANNRKGRDE